MNNIVARHGDLVIIQIDSVKGEKQKSKILLDGEVTGHSHRLISGDVFNLAEPIETSMGLVTRTVELREPTLLIHEDHNPIRLEAGRYGVIRQREQLMGRVRDVSD